MSQKIGFVGVGRMGANMARCLQETGFTIAAVFDANVATAQSLAQELGCVAAGELKAARKRRIPWPRPEIQGSHRVGRSVGLRQAPGVES